MSLVVLVEGERMVAGDWRARLGLDAATWDELVGDGVFARIRGDAARAMRLAFVGLVGLDDVLLACVPRFGLSAADPVAWLRHVLAVYFSREGRRSRDDRLVDLHHRDESVFREIDALATLLNAFAERGLHRRAVAVASPAGSGAVDWALTMARRDPLIVGGMPFYPDPWRRERRSAENEVSRLQAAATVWLARRYGLHLPSTLTDAVAGIDLDARMSPERARFDLALIGRERSVTYLAADLRVLDALEAVVSGRRRMAGVAGVRLHGTASFALVWEDAVRDLFGDDSADASLGHANWFDREGDAWSEARPAADRRLDLLVRRDGEAVILDAKYHHPFPSARPGWADVVKQLYYAESLVRLNGESVRNGFLLPRAGARLALAGLVSVTGGERDFPPVEAWTLDPDWVFSGYGDGDPARRASARSALFAARDEVAEVLGDA